MDGRAGCAGHEGALPAAALFLSTSCEPGPGEQATDPPTTEPTV